MYEMELNVRSAVMLLRFMGSCITTSIQSLSLRHGIQENAAHKCVCVCAVCGIMLA